MQSLAIQPSVSASGSFKTSTFASPTAKTPFKSSFSARPNASHFQSPTLPDLKFSCLSRRNTHLSASSAAAVEASGEVSTFSTQPEEEKEKIRVVVKPMQRPRIVLKFIWMEKNVGLALNQVIPGHGTIPLGPYYLWPRKDAWEELKVMLENKPWISQKQMIILLNQATDVINLWQQSSGDLS